jgi:hypothetical protein
VLGEAVDIECPPQRHDFLAERKGALGRWGAHVEQIIQRFGPTNNKVQDTIAPAKELI